MRQKEGKGHFLSELFDDPCILFVVIHLHNCVLCEGPSQAIMNLY